MVIDMKDRRLLYALDKNSRLSFSQLAKKVSLSQESVRYRIKRLVENGIILKFFTKVNVPKLGLNFYKVLLKIHNVDTKKKEHLTTYLIQRPEVAWVAETDGSYDLSFVLLVQNLIVAKSFLSELYHLYGAYISKRFFSVNLAGEYLPRDYLISKERRKVYAQKSYDTEDTKVFLDKNNLKILSLLAENSRASAVEIAHQIKMSPDGVLQRLRKLEKEKIITGYNLVLNHTALHQMHYKVFLYLNNISKEKENALYVHCRAIPQVAYIINSFGEWDLELDIEVESSNDFREIMMHLTSRFSDLVSDYSYLVIYKIRKYNLLPLQMIPLLKN